MRAAYSSSTVKQSKKASLFDVILPSAHAEITADYVANKAFTVPIGTGVVGGGLFGGFVYIMSGGVAGGVALYAAGGAAIGAAVGAAGCTVVQGWMRGQGFWDRYKNCVTAPLSAMGMNPRDRLYLKDIESCSDSEVVVQVESTSGLREKRVFQYKGGKVQSAVLHSEVDGESKPMKAAFIADKTGTEFVSGATSKNNRTTAVLTPKQMAYTTALIRDADYYRGLCNDDERRAEILKRIHSGEESGARAYDQETLEQLHDGAVNAE